MAGRIAADCIGFSSRPVQRIRHPHSEARGVPWWRRCGAAGMHTRTAAGLAPEVLQLFDQHVHGGISHRGFFEAAVRYAVRLQGQVLLFCLRLKCTAPAESPGGAAGRRAPGGDITARPACRREWRAVRPAGQSISFCDRYT